MVEGNFTYSNCGGSCTVTEQSASSTIEVEREGHETASVTGREGEVHVNCIGINCYFDGKGLLGTAKGPLLSTQANGEVSVQEQAVHKTKGTFCPSTAKLDITTTPLSATCLGSGAPELEMACLEVEAGEGFFLGAENGTCIGETETAQGNYEMAYVLSGTPNYQHVCAKALWPRGTYLSSNWKECSWYVGYVFGTYILGVRLPLDWSPE